MNYLKFFFIVLFCSGVLLSQNIEIVKPVKIFSTSFAIVVDSKTYSECKQSVLNYKQSVENDSLSAYILVSDWNDPRTIRNELKKLYDSKPKLEGAVFIGDVPIPMIRNAQHMTSAFKLDEERYPWFRSACPSDRFYEDFDLKFNFLSKDTVHTLCYYYSLAPESPQKIQKEIYSARMKPSGTDIDKYALIRKYLDRVVKQKEKAIELNHAFVFTGHGYNSESLDSWADERMLMKELFPDLYKGGGRMEFWNHAMSREIKDIVLAKLQEPEMDMAIFHAHGDVDMQLLASYPIPANAQENIEAVKMFFRSKVRTAKERKQNVDEAIKYYKTGYDVPDSWFDGIFSDSLIAADSILNYKLDIYLNDIRNIKPYPKYVMFDECFNGSYHQDEYVAGEYVFGNGEVITGEGNAVNCLQDKYADELIGLFNYGIRAGLRHREINNLETHLIGDPTFRFANQEKINFNYLLSEELRKNETLWKVLSSSQYPVLRSLAYRRLKEMKGSSVSAQLLKAYKEEASYEVRTTLFKLLAECNDENTLTALSLSINDPYEFVRRKTAEIMGETGDRRFIAPLAKSIITDVSDRVAYSARESIGYLGIEESGKVFEQVINAYPVSERNTNMLERFKGTVNRNKTWVYDELLKNICSDTLKLKSRLSEARTFRNYKFHEVIPQILKVVEDPKQPEQLRTHCAEALGWFNISNRRFKIIAGLKNVAKQDGLPAALKAEITRSINRLETGPNDVMLP